MKLEDMIQMVLNNSTNKTVTTNCLGNIENAYEGFNMHEDSEETKEANLILLTKFEELFSTDIKDIKSHLKFYKGCGEFTYRTFIIDFCGCTTASIISWLVKNSEKIIEIENLKQNMTKQIKFVPPRLIPQQTRYSVLKRQKWKCNQCGEILKFNKDSSWKGKVGHIDHIHPYSKAETYKYGMQNINELNNLQGLCPNCNQKKGKKEIQ